MKIRKEMKRGSIALIYPICIGVFIIIMSVFIMCIIYNILPFMYYQKLNYIVSKYMFVIEKFGYLTNDEKNNMLSDMENAGFEIDNVNITCPSVKQEYGSLIEFKVSYSLYTRAYSFEDFKIVSNEKENVLCVRKNSYIKS